MLDPDGLFARWLPIGITGFLSLDPRRVLSAPVRPVGHQATYFAIVVGLLLLFNNARLHLQYYFLSCCIVWLVI